MICEDDEFDEAFTAWYKELSDPDFITKRNYKILVTAWSSKAQELGLTLEQYYELYPEDLL